MIVTTDNEEVRQARKSMVEMLLGIIRWIARCATPAASANCRT